MPNECAHVDWDRLVVTFDDGASGRIIEIMDDDGDETEDADLAAALLIEDATGRRQLIEIGSRMSEH